MWWEFHRLMDLTPERARRRGSDRSACSSRSKPSGRDREGQADLRYRFPAQDFDLGRGEVYDPAQKQARPGRLAVRAGGRRVVAFDRRGADRRPASGSADATAAPARRSCRSTGSGPRPSRSALLRLGDWVAEHGHRRPTARTGAFRELLLGRRPRVGQCRRASRSPRPARPTSRPRGGWPSRSTARCSPIQGPPGLGQDVHRRADDLRPARSRQAGRHHRRQPQGDRQPPRGGREAAADEGVDGPDRAAWRRRTRSSTTSASSAARTTADVAGAADAGLCEPRRGHAAGCGRRTTMADAVDVLFVDEAGQMSLANVARDGRGRDSFVLLGDPQQLDQPLQGHAPAGRRRSALGHLLDGARTMPRTGACSSRRRGGSIPTCARSRPRCSTRAGSSRSRTSRQRVVSRRRPGRRRRARGSSAVHERGRQRVAERGGGRRGARARVVEGGRGSDRRARRRARLGWDDVLVVAPYNAQVAAIKRAAAGRGPRRAPSTSSRARRRRSRLLDDDLVARSSRRAAWSSSTAATG